MSRIKYNPFTGGTDHYLTVQRIRRDFSSSAWLYDPNTGALRNAIDVGNDCFGERIVIDNSADLDAINQLVEWFEWDKIVYLEGDILNFIQRAAYDLLFSLIEVESGTASGGGFYATKETKHGDVSYDLKYILASSSVLLKN